MKKCVKCGAYNDEDMRFCEECASPLPETKKVKSVPVKEDKDEVYELIDFIFEKLGKLISKISHIFTNKQDRIDDEAYANKSKGLVPDKITLCEGEIPIKQYYCAKERFALLGINTKHIIQVTNKRMIYCKMGNSFFGTKISQTEVPVEDIASLSIERGYKFNLFAWLFAGFLMLPKIIFAVIAAIISHYLVMIDGLGAIAFLSSVGLFVLSIVKKQITINRKKFDISNAVYYAAFGMFLGMMLSLPSANIMRMFGGGNGNVFLDTIFGSYKLTGKFYNAYTKLLKFSGIVIYIKAIIEFLKFVVKKYFCVRVGSKAGSCYPIETGGIEQMAFSMDILDSFIPVEPACDEKKLENELNAMILDLQQLGDYGLEKWKED